LERGLRYDTDLEEETEEKSSTTESE